jgi:hypothetical protein
MRILRSIGVKLAATALVALAGVASAAGTLPAQSQSQQNPTTEARKGVASPSRGKKLVLKDGSFQLAREYQRNGERVRYFSSERGDWEELPASMIDWDATAKAESAEANEQETLVKTVRKEELEKRRDVPLDVDASLPVAPGIFLPPGEGMFVVEGKSVTPLNQVGAEIRTDKKQLLKQVLSPVPIVPSKRNVEIPGAKSVRRINSDRPEFYLREAPPDPDATSTIHRSGRLGDNGPDVELIRLVVKGGKREIESIRSLFGEKLSEDRNSISVQRWDIAQTVFRFTLNEDLPSGEYAFAEILPDGVNLYVWDFGVDRKTPAKK